MTAHYKTKSAVIYDRLRLSIMNGKLKPGQKIVMSALAKKFSSSPIPVREAMKKLESEGLVQIEPHVGAIVTQFDLSKTMEMYRVRGELECIAIKWAIPLIGTADIRALEKLNAQMDIAAHKEDYGKMATLNRDFHLRVYKACDSPFLVKLIEELWDKNHVRSFYSVVPARAAASVREHEAMIQAIKKKDADLVESLLREQKSASVVALNEAIAAPRRGHNVVMR